MAIFSLKKYQIFLLIILGLLFNSGYSQDLNLVDEEDLKLLEDGIIEPIENIEESTENNNADAQSSKQIDDLDELRDDVGEIEFNLPPVEEQDIFKDQPVTLDKNKLSKKEEAIVFDVGKEEKQLVEIAKKMRGKIPDQEWNEIAGESVNGTYEVVEGDWLWKISKNLFGSGFYYAKIWALNPYITNPHEIEPGMILSFSTGSERSMPNIRLGGGLPGDENQTVGAFDNFGDGAKPDWITERENLKTQGVYFQYSSADTLVDLENIGKDALNNEFDSYEPPRVDFDLEVPEAEYDSSGFDKNSKIIFDYKDGFHLNTFVSTNVVQDFGKVESSINEQGLFANTDTVYLKFDEKINVVPGDKFSIYISQGKVSNINSDRKGFQYTIVGSVEVVQKHKEVWEARIIETSGLISRGDRLTIYTPKLETITKTYNPRLIESVLIGGHSQGLIMPSFGDVVYLDRGRADGVEIGNVFDVYGFKDRATGKNITEDPTYKNGELTVITVTENFSTALVSNSRRDFEIGDIAITKTEEAAARAQKYKERLKAKNAEQMDAEALDEIDVELNLDDLNDSLLDKADQIQFTEDELAELERQEREKSIISENEQDLKALEQLESEIETAEKILLESKLDEDKLLENQSLDKIEGDFKVNQQESLEEIEENFGKRYLDEDLNDKENPFGLTEFDIEEIDELLNVEENKN